MEWKAVVMKHLYEEFESSVEMTLDRIKAELDTEDLSFRYDDTFKQHLLAQTKVV